LDTSTPSPEKKNAANAAALSSTVRNLEQLIRLCVVLVLVDALAHVIRFAIELALVFFGQMAVVLRHVFLFVILQTLFAVLQATGFPGSELATLNAVADAVLLVLFALIHLIDAGMTRIDP